MDRTDQGRAIAGLIADLACKLDGKLSDMDDRYQRQVSDAVRDIAKLNDDFDTVRGRYRERFRETADHYHRGGAYRGPYRDAGQAKQVGNFFTAVLKNDSAALAEMRAAVDTATQRGRAQRCGD